MKQNRYVVYRRFPFHKTNFLLVYITILEQDSTIGFNSLNNDIKRWLINYMIINSIIKRS